MCIGFSHFIVDLLAADLLKYLCSLTLVLYFPRKSSHGKSVESFCLLLSCACVKVRSYLYCFMSFVFEILEFHPQNLDG